MKTLVIHPKDTSTDFLCTIYADKKDWTVINDAKVSNKKLIEQIKAHERIVMLGHGTEEGLVAVSEPRGMRFLIDSNDVYLLRDKQCVCIWCNADVFVKKYKLKGFYTGMIVSEYDEAIMYCLHKANSKEIIESNMLFADSVKNSIDKTDMLAEMKKAYTSEINPVINFNKDNLYHTIK